MRMKDVTEVEILCVECPTCHAKVFKTCRSLMNRNVPLSKKEDDDSLTFHSERVEAAEQMLLATTTGTALTPSQKALLVYYAFIMLCDSVQGVSKQMIGKEYNSLEIQAFFGKKALDELQNDGLIPRSVIRIN